MDGPEIRQRIDEINNTMHDLINKFVLTDEIRKLIDEKAMLSSKCSHIFEEGKCIYCDKKEGESK